MGQNEKKSKIMDIIHDFEVSAQVFGLGRPLPWIFAQCLRFFRISGCRNIGCVKKKQSKLFWSFKGKTHQILKEVSHERPLQAFIVPPRDGFYANPFPGYSYLRPGNYR